VISGTADSIASSTRDEPEARKMGDQSMRILVFSHKPEVRESIINAIGRRPATDLARVDYVEVSGIGDVLSEMDAGQVDLAILDGEAQPTGGIGLTRQLKNEITDCPPIVVAVRRKDDRWLATWSQADAVLVHPLDPLTAAETVADVLRARRVPVING
jgi:DNA-binding response OmpR family regulator